MRNSGQRPAADVRSALADAFADYLAATPEQQELIDEDRVVPVLEMHRILGYFLETGRFSDEL